MFWRLIARIQQVCLAPLHWHKAFACQLPKASNKGSCFQVRLVYAMVPVGKCFYIVLCSNMIARELEEYVHGYVQTRSRDGPIFVQGCFLCRLSGEAVSYVSTLHDATNASMSVSHGPSDLFIQIKCPTHFVQLAKQRVRQASFDIMAFDGMVTLRPQAGVLRGDPFAVRAFTVAMPSPNYLFDAVRVFRVAVASAIYRYFSCAFKRAFIAPRRILHIGFLPMICEGFPYCLGLNPLSGNRCRLLILLANPLRELMLS